MQISLSLDTLAARIRASSVPLTTQHTTESEGSAKRLSRIPKEWYGRNEL